MINAMSHAFLASDHRSIVTPIIPREDKSISPKGFHVADTRWCAIHFQGRFALTTASVIGIHVTCTSRARTQVIRRTSEIGREMPPMILDVAAALGRIVPAWGPPPPPPPPPLLYLLIKRAILRTVPGVPHFRFFLRSFFAASERAMSQSLVCFSGDDSIALKPHR